MSSSSTSRVVKQTNWISSRNIFFTFKKKRIFKLYFKYIRAGYKVTVIDASDPDWWRGKCLGKVGFFPSKYVTKLAPNEKPLQVTHNLQLSDDADDGALHKVLRDQVIHSFIQLFQYRKVL